MPVCTLCALLVPFLSLPLVIVIMFTYSLIWTEYLNIFKVRRGIIRLLLWQSASSKQRCCKPQAVMREIQEEVDKCHGQLM